MAQADARAAVVGSAVDSAGGSSEGAMAVGPRGASGINLDARVHRDVIGCGFGGDGHRHS